MGLRIPHLRHVLEQKPRIPWFEVHSCNYLSHSPNRDLLLQVAEHYPISLHGVSLNLGGIDPLDLDYLRALRQLRDDTQALLVSDHVCFTTLNGQYYHDLLPVPFTLQGAQHLALRVEQVQEMLGQTILVENATRYYHYPESDMGEGEFLSSVCRQSGCDLLLDISNAYINQQNLGEPIRELLKQLPTEIIGEIHLGGYRQGEVGLVDSHDHPMSEEVWQLFEAIYPSMTHAPILIEWDSDLPSFDILELLQQRANGLASKALR